MRLVNWILSQFRPRPEPGRPEPPDRAPVGSPPRSPHWPQYRKAHLAREPACLACGGVKELQVHHVVPFHVRPALELVEANLMTLCEAPGRECHLNVGHHGDWRKFNPRAREDAAAQLAALRRARS